MKRIIVAGCGTSVGKTIVSGILTQLLRGDYWKPIQSGNAKTSDTSLVSRWIDDPKRIHNPAYSLKAPLSPHHAARLENISLKKEAILLPETKRPLIIESVGGILVPLSTHLSSLELFKTWEAHWVIVSKHYLGSINHTLLTIEVLKVHQIPLLGIIFNGKPCPDSEAAILGISQLPILGRLLPERTLNAKTLQKYVNKWRPNFPMIH